MEKETQTNKRNWSKWIHAAAFTILGAGALYGTSQVQTDRSYSSPAALTAEMAKIKDLCPNPKKIVPSFNQSYYEPDYFRTSEYKKYSVGVWGDAVRVITPSYDDLGKVGEDSRWEVMHGFEDYILKTFPTFKEKTELTHVNTYALVFVLNGTDPSLKPLMLTGHQDVVPVPKETEFEWKYPPFSGHFDGDWVWGRGTCDCKNSVTALLEALETLLKQGFKPARTVVIALGADEEIGGYHTARPIGEYLVKRFGEDSMSMIVDEGTGVYDVDGARYAIPAMGEKGYIDVQIDLLTSGGHSSIPPKHTGIGIMGEIITAIEDRPYTPVLHKDHPFYHQLQCEAKYSKMSIDARHDILTMGLDPVAKARVLARLESDINTRFMVSTSQAIDVVRGGLKINALPEKTSIKINHRVAIGGSVQQVKDKISGIVKKVAKKYDLGFQDFDSAKAELGDIPTGYFELTAIAPLEPAPVTPVGTAAWALLAGTTRHVFEDFAIYPDADPKTPKEVINTPSISTGNTDTKHYWALTKNIFRYGAFRMDGCVDFHTVNERGNIDAHVETVAWYYQFLRNVEEYGPELGL